MRGHVVRAFVVVHELGVAVRGEAGKERLQVLAHRRRGVLAQDQGGAGVLQEHVAEALSYPAVAYHALQCLGDLRGAPSCGT
jgi:hypothetical protein